jgi:hypothetical protein
MKREPITWASNVEPYLPAFWHTVLKESQRRPEWSRSMIFSVALANASFACMHHAEVLQPDGQRCDLGVFTLVNGESGVGKTPVFDIFHQPAKDQRKWDETIFATATSTFNTVKQLWNLKAKGLARAIVKAVQAKEPVSELEDAMINHENDKPKQPHLDRMLIQAMSISSFMKVANGEHNRLFLAHPDARVVVKKGGMMDNLDAFCVAWDYDGTYMLDSAYNKYEFSELLMSMLLMLQPIFFTEFIWRGGGAARESGFTPRCLITHVTKDQELDLIDNEPTDGQCLRDFLARLAHFLAEASKQRSISEYDRTELTFSPEAIKLWDDTRKEIDKQQDPGGLYENIRDFAFKFMSNVSRIAGIFHCMNTDEGEISVSNLHGAIALMLFYAANFQAIYEPIESVPKSVSDAWRVLHYLYFTHWTNKVSQVAYNDVLQSRRVREGVRTLDAAIDHLALKGYISVDRGRKKFIRLNNYAFRSINAEELRNQPPLKFSSSYAFSFDEPMTPQMPMGSLSIPKGPY